MGPERHPRVRDHPPVVLDPATRGVSRVSPADAHVTGAETYHAGGGGRDRRRFNPGPTNLQEITGAEDYAEHWQMHAVCSCGAHWDLKSGRRRVFERFDPVRRTLAQHVRMRHSVVIYTGKLESYNLQLIAQVLAEAMLAALTPAFNLA